jgi:hypothetical protein
MSRDRRNIVRTGRNTYCFFLLLMYAVLGLNLLIEFSGNRRNAEFEKLPETFLG